MIKIIQGDITTLSVDAIVNAAKRAVAGGEGVFISRGGAERRRRGDGSRLLLLFGAG